MGYVSGKNSTCYRWWRFHRFRVMQTDCRTQSASALIIFDIYENNAYDIQQELKKTMPNVHIETLIGSVRNEEKNGRPVQKVSS